MINHIFLCRMSLLLFVQLTFRPQPWGKNRLTFSIHDTAIVDPDDEIDSVRVVSPLQNGFLLLRHTLFLSSSPACQKITQDLVKNSNIKCKKRFSVTCFHLTHKSTEPLVSTLPASLLACSPSRVSFNPHSCLASPCFLLHSTLPRHLCLPSSRAPTVPLTPVCRFFLSVESPSTYSTR
jgi:hypothetical protein